MDGPIPREKLAELFMVGFRGAALEDELKLLIEKHSFSSFILFGENASDSSSLSALTAEARSVAKRSTRSRLLFAADEEGGLISPLGHIVGRLPSAMALAAGRSPSRAREAVRAVGGRLKALGVDLVLAPVLDVNVAPANPVIGTRSFGDDAASVARMAGAVMDGYRAGGLVCCGKHFPGHGRTTDDSHKTLPVVTSDEGEIERCELVPFVQAIERRVGSLMAAHVAYPALDGGAVRPATVSANIQTRLLRERLGFTGVLLSDSIEMRGLSGAGAPEKACVEALKAGVDLFVSVDPDLALRCAGVLEKETAADGGLRREALRALANVARLKEAAARATVEESPGDGTEGLLARCYRESITLLGAAPRDLAGKLAAAESGVLIVPEGLPGYERIDVSVFYEALRAAALSERWRIVSYPFDPPPALAAEIVALAGSSDAAVLCALARGAPPAGQRELAAGVIGTGKLAAGVALLDPYCLAHMFPAEAPRLATYGFWPEALAALGRVLFDLTGRTAPGGSGGSREACGAPGLLPVDITGGGW